LPAGRTARIPFDKCSVFFEMHFLCFDMQLLLRTVEITAADGYADMGNAAMEDLHDRHNSCVRNAQCVASVQS
jgi:hypothetical protein